MEQFCDLHTHSLFSDGTYTPAQLIDAACEGAKEEGAEVKVYNMYDLEKYSGCISCFGCKLEKNLGHYKDELITTEIVAEYPHRII